MKTDEEDTPVPLQQDIRMIDYLQEFDTFIGKRQTFREAEGVRCVPRAGGVAVRDGRAPGDGGMIAIKARENCSGDFAPCWNHPGGCSHSREVPVSHKTIPAAAPKDAPRRPQ